MAWLLCFSAERFLAPLAPSRFLHVDAVMQDPSLSLAEKLRGVASSWVGRALLASFVVCVGVLALAIVRAIAG